MGDTPATSSPAPSHVWKFSRVGGFDQVKLQSGADLLALADLDQKLWVALSCPTRGVEFDARTLDLIDTDKDGRIRAPEILAAVRWACACLKNPDDLTRGPDPLPLGAINDATPEGKQLLASAKRILANLGKPDASAIGVADTTDTTAIFAQTRFNGDGAITADAADDEATQAVIGEIIMCLGSVPDLSGKPGVNQGQVDQFFADLRACADWWKQGEDSAATVRPLGEATPAAFEALQAVRAKVDDYFARCGLAAFDARSLEVLSRSVADFAALAPKDLSTATADIAAFPLAKVEAGRPLPLTGGINPAWAAAIAKLRSAVVAPILGPDKTSLSAAEWAEVTAKLAPYEAWLARKAGASVEKLGCRIREILGSNAKEALAALIAKDKALEPEMNAIGAVDRLVRYARDLFRLLNNFVSFEDFYSRAKKAIFQAGTLYLDGRSCDLCVRVDDAGKHAALATLSRTYLAYCDCARKGTTEKMTIAAAFTGGDSDNLMVGRNGVFYDRKGQDWDATITKVIEHPISIPQAFWSPYKRIGRMIGEQIEKLATARDKAAIEKAAGHVEATAKSAEAGKATPQPFDIAKFAGIFAAIGLALGAMGAAFGYLFKSAIDAFAVFPWWQIPIAIGGVILAVILVISGPSMIIAWLKLRQRNLGPILDANGWAVNARVKLSIPFGHTLTGTAKLPPNAQRLLLKR